FLLCTNLFGDGVVPIAAMLIYLVHPEHTEAVTSIVGRSELFSACFFMGAWLLFRKGRTIWAAGLFSLALLSKENAIVLPAILVLDVVFPHSGISSASVVKNGGYRRYFGRLALMSLVAIGYLVLRLSVLGSIGIPVSAQYMAGRLSYFDRFITSGRVFIHYL